MKYLTQEESDALATKFISLRDKAKKTKSKKIKKEFQKFQNECIKHFQYLIHSRTYKYKTFSNYFDLEQDGFEALLLSLKTYNPSKGSFTWWADKYISTRISRAANAHSTIKVPIKKARELKPHKITDFPLMIDDRPNPLEITEQKSRESAVHEAIVNLPEEQRQVINLVYGLNGTPVSIEVLMKKLSLSRPKCIELLKEAEKSLRKGLRSKV